jgi:hypothetical protein
VCARVHVIGTLATTTLATPALADPPAAVVTTGASDHLPVVVDLELPGKRLAAGTGEPAAA